MSVQDAPPAGGNQHGGIKDFDDGKHSTRASFDRSPPWSLQDSIEGHVAMIAAGLGAGVVQAHGVLTTRCPLCWRSTLNVAIEDGVFFCSAECPLVGHGEGLLRLARAADRMLPFTPEQAQEVWLASLAREREHDHRDQPARDYLAGRGLLGVLEIGAAGLLGMGVTLPWRIDWWPTRGYVVVAPLYNDTGELVAVQARSIRPDADRKTMFPGGIISGAKYFANGPGRDLLADRWRGIRTVLIGEGMTDSMALALVLSNVPALCLPGVGRKALGPWVKGLDLLVATDLDAAGEGAVPQLARIARDHGARRVSRLRWPGTGKDACDALSEVGVEALGAFLAEVTRG